MTRLLYALALCLALLPGVVWAEVEEQTSSVLVEVVPYLHEGVLVHKTVWPDGSVTFACPERPGSVCPAPAPEPVADVPTLIVQAARRWGVSPSWALAVAWCESRYSPTARGSAGEMGVFQFLPSTFATTPYRHGNPWDAATNIEAAMWLVTTEGPRHWTCARGRV